MTEHSPQAATAALIRAAASDGLLKEMRHSLAVQTATALADAGEEVRINAEVVGPDLSSVGGSFGGGSPEAVAVAVLLRVAGQLVGGSVALFESGLTYAASALIRQLVEVEYLAWAIDTEARDAERWLRSDRKVILPRFGGHPC